MTPADVEQQARLLCELRRGAGAWYAKGCKRAYWRKLVDPTPDTALATVPADDVATFEAIIDAALEQLGPWPGPNEYTALVWEDDAVRLRTIRPDELVWQETEDERTARTVQLGPFTVAPVTVERELVPPALFLGEPWAPRSYEQFQQVFGVAILADEDSPKGQLVGQIKFDPPIVCTADTVIDLPPLSIPRIDGLRPARFPHPDAIPVVVSHESFEELRKWKDPAYERELFGRTVRGYATPGGAIRIEADPPLTNEELSALYGIALGTHDQDGNRIPPPPPLPKWRRVLLRLARFLRHH